ncbi:putative thiazole-containing bacteriocin maturation protein [Fictibacillus sp. KIGAM418]|uniref:Thiazole-containing bacteriocin maturation protein n=1 Tax=Fictibacillus marinisediminis TaxID=2878389 RepID=A0A9X2BFH1_9BACL|nr:putative thiazole-containing bacteriocin maturation protein [Fictibacillus marinisediminis]MCK6255478.1 putative thiazole-containing bacteriocin maturation protein [Fictibacillus marinisediminis]
MQKLNPSMCLKVNRDTFVFPDSAKGVYLRNNVKSLRMEGSTIDRWLEKLIPIFDGTHTLDSVTNGLPDAYKEQVYKIAHVLYENGFVRDVSQDLPHQLPDRILAKYASQIEYLDHIRDSGGYRFQVYRHAKVAVIGSDSLLLSLVRSLIESGLPSFSVILTESHPTIQQRLNEMIAEARKSEPETKITILSSGKNSWRENAEPFDCILYGCKDSDLSQLRTLLAICKEQKKTVLPVTILKDLAFAGPLVSAESDSCWESAFRRLHQTLNEEGNGSHSLSLTAGALLANVAVFELFKEITGVHEEKKERPFYLLNLETLEGSWHTFLPHPLVTGRVYAEPIKDPATFLETGNHQQMDLHSLFYRITSKECGVFHLWEEADLLQLPLSQCKVQVADPRSEGPAKLYPETVCSGLTHEEARLEAGLLGIETYARSFGNDFFSEHPLSWGIGMGKTPAEGLCRALQNALHEEFVKQADHGVTKATLDVSLVNDHRCQFFLQALRTKKSEPEFFWGREVLDFPVVWVESNGKWYGSVGLNMQMALSRALQTAVMDSQNRETSHYPYGVVVSSITSQKDAQQKVPVPSFEEKPLDETFHSAIHRLRQNKKQANIFELHLEAIFKENTAGIYGIALSGEELP